VASVKWKEDLTAASDLARSSRRKEAAAVAAVNTAIITGIGIERQQL
jgi:hypothetical protein